MARLRKSGGQDGYGRVWYDVICDGEIVGSAYRYAYRDEDDGTYYAEFCRAGLPSDRTSECTNRTFREPGQALRWLKVKAGMRSCGRKR